MHFFQKNKYGQPAPIKFTTRTKRTTWRNTRRSTSHKTRHVVSSRLADLRIHGRSTRWWIYNMCTAVDLTTTYTFLSTVQQTAMFKNVMMRKDRHILLQHFSGIKCSICPPLECSSLQPPFSVNQHLDTLLKSAHYTEQLRSKAGEPWTADDLTELTYKQRWSITEAGATDTNDKSIPHRP